MAKRIRAILEATDRASPKFNKVAAATKALGGVAASVGAFQLGTVLARGFADVTRVAAEQESQERKLQAALEQTGQYSKALFDDLKRQAAALQSVTTAGDEQIIAGQALLVSFGLQASQAEAAAQAALNYGAVIGNNEQAFRQIAKTLGGYAGELGELIPELKDLTKEQLAAGAAIDIINEKFRGQAAAAADTYTGRIQQLNNTFGDIKENIGRPFIEAFRVAADEVLRPFAERIGNTDAVTKTYRDTVLLTAEAIARLAAVGEAALSPIVKVGAALAILKLDSMVRDLKLLNTALAGLQGLRGGTEGFFANLASELRELRTEAGATASVLSEPLITPGAVETTVDGLTEVKDTVRAVAGEWLTIEEAVRRLAEEGLEVFRVQAEVAGTTIESFSRGVSRNLRVAGVGAAQQFGDALVDAAFSGELAFGEFFKALLKDLAKAILQAIILQAILGGIGFSRGGSAPGGSGNLGNAGRSSGTAFLNRGGVVGAQRGMITPGIDQNRDSVPALLQPGEMVLRRDVSDKILNALDRGGSGGPVQIELTVPDGDSVAASFAQWMNFHIRQGSARLFASELVATGATR